MDTTHDDPLALHIGTAPAYEFLLSLCVWSDVPHHATSDLGPEWFAAVRAQAPRELLDAVARFARESDMVWAHLLTFVPEDPAPPDVPAFIALLERRDPVEVHLRLVGSGVRYCQRATPAAVMRAAVAGDPAARREFLRTSHPEDAAWQAALRHLLAQDSPALHAALLAILRGWYDAVFRAQEPGLAGPIACEAAHRRAQLAHDPPLAVVRTAASGFEYVPEEGIRRVVLVPSVVARPQLFLLDHDDTKWICTPVADECLTADPLTPPPRLLRLLRALGDERRLRLLRLLASGSFALGPLAARAGLSKTLAHHHLTVLRGAGLVLVRGGNPTIYTLRYDTLARVGPTLDAFLAPPPREERPDAPSS
jgi:DNA-binding transcriptional ArsR family regulator